MKVHRDKIVGFAGSWGSGLATLNFEHGAVHADNGPLVRALDSMIGGVIGRNHTVNNGALAGFDVVYYYDDLGLCLGGLIPYSAWLEAGYPEIGLGQSAEIDPDNYA